MRRWVIVTLGASDIQYSSEKQRLADYAEHCEMIYNYLQQGGNYQEIDAPLLKALVSYLVGRNLTPDRMLVYYTLQNSEQPGNTHGHPKDTYWAFRVIQYLAQETDFFGLRFPVEGVHVQGNPADYIEMLHLYKDVMTVESLRSMGVRDEDELYACFTAGAPTMTHYLLMGFSALNFPRRRECFTVQHNNVTNASVIRPLQVTDLLRHEDTFRLLKKLLESRQFNEASLLMSSISFTFLDDCRDEAKDWIKLLHERYLFCFGRALHILGRCQSVFVGENFLDRMKRELEMLERGMKKYQGLDEDTASSLELKVLMSEYLHKVLFFWDSEQWNEFTYVASSFFEWVIQVAFFDAIGYSLARQNTDEERKNWGQFLKRQYVSLPDWLKSVVDNRNEKGSDRIFCTNVLRQHDKWKNLANSDWFLQMEKFYSDIRNIRVHQLQGTQREDVIQLLGSDWPQKTKAVLSEYFAIEAGTSKFKKAIQDFIEFLNKKFVRQYGVSTITE